MPFTRTNKVMAALADFIPKSKKAVAGGIAGAAIAITTHLPPAIADGVFEIPGELLPVLTWTLGGFVLGFAGVWIAPANKVDDEPEDDGTEHDEE